MFQLSCRPLKTEQSKTNYKCVGRLDSIQDNKHSLTSKQYASKQLSLTIARLFLTFIYEFDPGSGRTGGVLIHPSPTPLFHRSLLRREREWRTGE